MSCESAYLFLGNYNLRRKSISCARYRMVQQTNTSYDLTHFFHELWYICRIDRKILVCIELSRRQNVHQRPMGRNNQSSILSIRLQFFYSYADMYANTYFPVFHYNFVNWFIQHVRSAVDGTESCKTLRKFAQPVHRIQIRRLSITG